MAAQLSLHFVGNDAVLISGGENRDFYDNLTIIGEANVPNACV
jgi:hypothetical protein